MHARSLHTWGLSMRAQTTGRTARERVAVEQARRRRERRRRQVIAVVSAVVAVCAGIGIAVGAELSKPSASTAP